MQALILAGGEGTRLRPLTTTVPKPVVPLVDRPFIAFMLDWLRGHGVDDIVMSCGHMASGVRNVLGDGSALRRAAALRRGAAAARHRRRAEVRRGAARRALPDAQRRRPDRPRPDGADRAARATGATATLALTPVEDPTAYGLVRTDGDGAVTEFVEKPSPDQIDTRNISAGAYVLERSVLDLLEPEQPASIERDVFPQLVGDGLYGYVERGLLARHRDARALPRGHVRHPRGHGRDRRSPSGRATATSWSSRRSRARGGSSRRRWSRAAAGSATARAGRRPRRARAAASRSASTRRSSARSSCRAPRSARTARCAAASSAAACGSATTRHVDGLSGARRGRPIGADNVVSNGARIFPGVDAPGRAPSSSDGRSIATAVARGRLHRPGRRDPGLPSTCATRCGASTRRPAPVDAPGGLIVAGMGGSAVGGRLARAALGDRAARPIVVADGYALPGWAGRRRSCSARATRATPRRRWPPTTTPAPSGRRGSSPPPAARWPSARARRRAGDPAARAASSRGRRSATRSWPRSRRRAGGAAPSLRDEVEAAAARRQALAAEWGPDDEDGEAKRIARALHGTVPVIAGAELTAPVAYRWKCQINENAKAARVRERAARARPQRGRRLGGGADARPVLGRLPRGPGRAPAQRLRAELTADIAAAGAAPVERVDARGETPVERLVSLVLLGDLVSLYPAVLRGADPVDIAAIDRAQGAA